MFSFIQDLRTVGLRHAETEVKALRKLGAVRRIASLGTLQTRLAKARLRGATAVEQPQAATLPVKDEWAADLLDVARAVAPKIVKSVRAASKRGRK